MLLLVEHLLIVCGTGVACSLLVLCVAVCLNRAQRRARRQRARKNRALLLPRSGALSSINSDAALSDVRSGDLAANDVVGLLNDAALAERRELAPFIASKTPRLLPTPLEILLRWERRLAVLLALFSLASVPLMVAFARGATLAADTGFGAVFAFFTIANADASSVTTALLFGTWFAVAALGAVLLLLTLVQHVRTFQNAAVTARAYTCAIVGIAQSASIDDVASGASCFGPVVSVAMPLNRELAAHCNTAFVTFLHASDALACVDQEDELRVCGRKVRSVRMASVESFELLTTSFHVGRIRRFFIAILIIFLFQVTAVVPLALKIVTHLCTGMLDDALHLSASDTVDEVVRTAIDLAFGLALHLVHKLIGRFLRLWLLPKMHLLTSSAFVLLEVVCLTSMRTGSLAAIVMSTTFQCLGLDSSCVPDPLGSRRWFETSTRTVASAIVGELLGNIVLAPLWRLVRKHVFRCNVGEATLDISHRIASINTTFLYAMQFGGPAPVVLVLASVCMAVQFANDSMQQLAFAKDALLSARGVDHAMIATSLSQVGALLVFSNLLVSRAFQDWLKPELAAYAALQVPLLVASICVFFLYWLARVILTSGVRCSRSLPPPQPITAHAVIDSFAFPGALRHKAEAMAAANGGTVRFDRHQMLFWARGDAGDDD